MRTKKVVVLPYDRTWKFAFEEIKREIEGAIGDLIIGIATSPIIAPVTAPVTRSTGM